MVTLEHRGDRVDVGAQFYHTNMQCALDLIDAMGMLPGESLSEVDHLPGIAKGGFFAVKQAAKDTPQRGDQGRIDGQAKQG